MAQLVIIIVLTVIGLWESSAITNKRPAKEQSGSVRYFRHIANGPSTGPLADWEIGLREALHQALHREGYWEPNLRERLNRAQLIGRQDKATPFGDVAVIARGQLYALQAGNFILLQDPYQNDCDDCHNPRRCERHDCQPYTPHNREILVALWTIKRLRHRDIDRTRFELEYIINPVNSDNDQIIMRRNRFNYAIPGHVFVIRSSENNKNYGEYYNRKIVHTHSKPEIILGVDSEGHKHVLYSYPTFITSVPPQSTPQTTTGTSTPVPSLPTPHLPISDTEEAELYKKLLEILSSKTSTTRKQEDGPHRFSLNQFGDNNKPQNALSTTPLGPQTKTTIKPKTEVTLPDMAQTMKTTVHYFMPTGEEILMTQHIIPTIATKTTTSTTSIKPTKKYFSTKTSSKATSTSKTVATTTATSTSKKTTNTPFTSTSKKTTTSTATSRATTTSKATTTTYPSTTSTTTTSASISTPETRHSTTKLTTKVPTEAVKIMASTTAYPKTTRTTNTTPRTTNTTPRTTSTTPRTTSTTPRTTRTTPRTTRTTPRTTRTTPRTRMTSTTPRTTTARMTSTSMNIITSKPKITETSKTSKMTTFYPIYRRPSPPSPFTKPTTKPTPLTTTSEKVLTMLSTIPTTAFTEQTKNTAVPTTEKFTPELSTEIMTTTKMFTMPTTNEETSTITSTSLATTLQEPAKPTTPELYTITATPEVPTSQVSPTEPMKPVTEVLTSTIRTEIPITIEEPETTTKITTQTTIIPNKETTSMENTRIPSTFIESTTQMLPTSTPQTSLFATTFTTKFSTTQRTTTVSDFLTEAEPFKGPLYIGTVRNDFNLDDIFGTTKSTIKPTTTTTEKPTESDISFQLFNNRKPENAKIIFSNFYEASTSSNSDGAASDDPSQDYAFLTSQSYETSVSFEVNKKNKLEYTTDITTSTVSDTTTKNPLANRKREYKRNLSKRTKTTTVSTPTKEISTNNYTHKKGVKIHSTNATIKKIVINESMEAPIKATLQQMPNNDTNFVVYKAEYPNEVTEGSLMQSTKEVLDDLALRLVNHAKSLELMSNSGNKTLRVKYRRRKTYLPRSKTTRKPVTKKKEQENS